MLPTFFCEYYPASLKCAAQCVPHQREQHKSSCMDVAVLFFVTFEGWVVQLHFFSFNKVLAAILSSSISCSSTFVIPTHSLLLCEKSFKKCCWTPCHPQTTFANIRQPLQVQSDLSFDSQKPNWDVPMPQIPYLQRHIVPVMSIWIWVKDFRLQPKK